MRALQQILAFDRPELRKLLESRDTGVILSICECLHNVLEGIVPIKINKLRRSELESKVLTSKTTANSVRRKVLLTEGGLSLLNLIVGPCHKYLTP